MPAPGGPTNQSGVGYQNAVVALYLGRLCDPTTRPPTETVIEVRNETHGPVDDIEVAFADSARKWMQAKERISVSSEEWKALWVAFSDKLRAIDTARGDRLVLWVGASSRVHEALYEATRRARGARDVDEWWSDLSKEQRAAAENVEACIGSAGNHDVVFELLRFVDIEIASREWLNDRIPFWIPAVRGATPHALYDVLQTRASEAARYRTVQTRPVLLKALGERGIDVPEPNAGETKYREAVVRETGIMEIPGTSLQGATSEVFHPPRIRVWQPPEEGRNGSPGSASRDLDDGTSEDAGEPVRLEDIPSGRGDRIVIMAGAGAGKSALLTSLAHRLAKSAWVPAVVRLVELANHGGSVIAFLEECTNRRYAAAVDWTDLCERGAALLLFDGLDEFPPHVRSSVLDEVKAFSARFPDAPWVLTVRDLAGAAAPPGARIAELKHLTAEDVEPFCRRWLPPARSDLARVIAAKVAISPEIRRMARIPFLLALIVERAASGNGAFPTRRNELLEQYVNALLRPEKRKPALPPQVDASVLRVAAEALAFAALNAGEIDLAAATAVTAIDGVGAAPQAVLDALVARGLLREDQTGRYAFVFPILQEYLAGYHLASKYREEIVPRFEKEVSRPWTQAVQFAIECSDHAEVLAVELLAHPDDAFRTKLKLLGRCIANGARVAPATRARVGDELAATWIREGTDGNWTGQLLADGFAKDLPGPARIQLTEGKQLQHGGADIITAAEDPSLTRAVLDAILKVYIPGHVFSWQSAIDAIAPDAAGMYLERAFRPTAAVGIERRLHWVAYILGRLANVRDADDPRVAYAREASGDPLLRLACLMRLGSQLRDDAAPLVIASFRRYVATETPNDCPMFDVVFDALFRLPNAAETWHVLLGLVEVVPLHAKPGAWWLRGLSPAEAYWRTVVSAVARRRSDEEAQALVRQLAATKSHPTTRRDYLDLVLAYVGDDGAFERLGQRLETLRREDVTPWLYMASRRPLDLVGPGLSRLSKIAPTHRGELAHLVGFAMSYEVEMMSIRGGASGRVRRRHAAASQAAALLKGWGSEAKVGSAERFACLAAAVNLGAKEIAPELLREVDANMSRAQGFGIDAQMGNAVTAIAGTGVSFTLDFLVRAAKASEHNLCLRAFAQLERLGSPEALDTLLALHADRHPRKDHKQLLARHIERLARALGVRIVGDPATDLTRTATA